MKLTVQELLEKFSDKTSHPYNVQKLSLMLFEELSKKVFEMDVSHKKLLEAAALLHDIGYFADAKSHNKHSQALIVEYGLEGFSKHERDMIACICRYHRGSLPDKNKHELYGSFEKKDRKTIKRLGGIVRLADGLDKAPHSLINDIKINFDRENNIIEIILIPASTSASLEIMPAVRKRDLLEIGFKVQSVIKISR